MLHARPLMLLTDETVQMKKVDLLDHIALHLLTAGTCALLHKEFYILQPLVGGTMWGTTQIAAKLRSI